MKKRKGRVDGNEQTTRHEVMDVLLGSEQLDNQQEEVGMVI